MAKETTIPFNILLKPAQHAKLSALAKKMSLSKSAVGRQAISHMYAMILGNSPTCANGHNCFVPHMHKPPVDIPPPPDPEPPP